MKKILYTWCAMILLVGVSPMAYAARTYTILQTPAAGTQFDMGSAQAVTYQITNTATPNNTAERIYEIRFRLPGTGTVFAGGTGPVGWTRITNTPTSVAFRANTWADALIVGASASFTVNMTMRTTTADINETLRDIRARFTTTTTPPFNNLQSIFTTPAGSWTLRSLAITSFQITDLAGIPITATTAGNSFRLVMTVRNVSSVTQNNIVSNPNPPTVVKTGTVTQVLTGTVSSPSPLNLAAGASGTITFTYSTVATDNGTIYFTATARNGATVTSRLATSSTLALSRLSAAIASSLACQYPGSNITITMTLTNGYPYNLLNVTPTLTPVAGAPVTFVSGPVPAAPIASVPSSPPTTAITWVYQINAAGTTNPFTFSGSASGTGNTAGSPVHTSQTTISADITRGNFVAVIDPLVTNAASTNVVLTTSITNNGCAAVNSVAITAPAGWGAATDPYSLVNLSAANAIETWTAAGANPVTFTAPTIAERMPLTFTGDFSIVYATSPAVAGPNIFNIRVTDANGIFQDIPLTVTVNAFKSGTLNNSANRIWREDFR